MPIQVPVGGAKGNPVALQALRNEIYKVSNYGASVFELFFAPSMPKQDIGLFAVGPTVEWYTRDTHVHRTAAHTGTRPTNSGPL